MKVLDIDGLNYYDGKIKQTYAPLASPTLTGTPTAPTPTSGDNSTKLATTAYVQGALSGATPTSIADTEIQQYWTGVTPEQVNQFLSLSGGTISGNLTVSGNLTAVASGNLPLSGGTMSGDIEFYDNLYLGSPLESDSNVKTKFAGLYSNKNNPHKYCGIGFVNEQTGNIRPQTNISAGDGTNRNHLIIYGDADGGVVYKDIDISIAAMGTNYIRYDNGLQICWGQTGSQTANANAEKSASITFPVAFKDTTYTISFIDRFGSGTWTDHTYSTSTYSTTSVNVYLRNNTTSNYTFTFSWMAIGTWK